MSSWGGGATPPPKPPSVAPPSGLPPPSSDGKKYANERQSELDALRQRGLARLLNKHFTSVTKAIAEERAAAEAALADLEARKANTSEFTSSNVGLTLYQQLYLELQEKKAACKRKEKETLLLYQRYVDKFASTGVVAVPNSRDMKIGLPPIPNTTKPASSYVALKKSPSAKVAEMAGEIDEKVSKHVSSGGDKIPSSHFMGMEETLQSRRASEEREHSEFSKRLLEAKGVDAVASPIPAKKKLANATQFGIPMSPDATSTVPKSKTSVDSNATTPSALETSAEDEDDDRSAVSGLTSVASQVMSEAEERLLDFLKTETEAIRKMMEDDESESVGSEIVVANAPRSPCVGTESALAAEKAEEMVKHMQKMLLDHAALRDGDTSRAIEPYELETPNPNEKWLVCWDETHQREYYYESKMGLTQWEKPNTDDDDYVPIVDYTKSSKSVLLSDDVTPGSPLTRMSRRDTYRRIQSRRRKRQRIAGAVFAVLACVAAYYGYSRHQMDPSFAAGLSRALWSPAEGLFDRVVGIERVKEINHVIYKTAIKFMPSSVTEDTERRIREEAERAVRAEIAAKEKERLARQEADRKANEEKARLAALEKAEKRAKEEQKKETERLNQEKAKQEEADRLERLRMLEEEAARLELERRAAAETKRKELSAKERRRQLQREKEEARRRAIEERKKMAKMRPWHCNFPLSYVVSKRCRKLSDENPIFDLRSFVDAMMQ
jgi:hypothetical protein